MQIRFIGDVHGQMALYRNCIIDRNNYDMTIQVGDFGYGFVPFAESDPAVHKRIRGNHDNPDEAIKDPCFLRDGSILTTGKNIMFFVGGALSIDRRYRTQGIDWWDTEELTYGELQKLIDQYDHLKPDVMVTHTCPESMIPLLFKEAVTDPSRTGQAFDAMLKLHRPKYWIFGHFHQNISRVVDGTRFICVQDDCYTTLEL